MERCLLKLNHDHLPSLLTLSLYADHLSWTDLLARRTKHVRDLTISSPLIVSFLGYDVIACNAVTCMHEAGAAPIQPLV